MKIVPRKIKKRLARLSRKLDKLVNSLTPFKSQKKQDRWVIFTALPFKRHGYFVDLAAADGITHSNSYALEKLFGWKGICIEPNPHFYAKLKEKRNCIADNSVVSDSVEVVEFRIDNAQLGGIVANDTDNSAQVRGEELKNATIISMTTDTLTSILDRHNAPGIMDYLSLDVEGSEERVLKNFDFNKYRFQCITIERPTPALNSVLADNGYIFVKNYRDDTFYVHSSLLQKRQIACQPFAQVPKKDW